MSMPFSMSWKRCSPMVKITYLREFLKQAKHLQKKYPSFSEDLKAVVAELSVNPSLGIDLGSGVRKIRMAIKSKGKSGGARVITFNYILDTDCRSVVLLAVYDKSEKESISDAEIISLRDKVHPIR